MSRTHIPIAIHLDIWNCFLFIQKSVNIKFNRNHFDCEPIRISCSGCNHYSFSKTMCIWNTRNKTLLFLFMENFRLPRCSNFDKVAINTWYHLIKIITQNGFENHVTRKPLSRLIKCWNELCKRSRYMTFDRINAKFDFRDSKIYVSLNEDARKN